MLNIILDSGHYPDQPGKRSPKLFDGRQFFEWRANWEICLLIAKKMAGENVSYPIKPMDRNAYNIERRCIFYNGLKKTLPGDMLIISVHSNAAGDGRRWHLASGIETYYWHSSNTGKTCAQIFQSELIKTFDWNDRGIKPTENLALLKNCAATVILTETGFFTHIQQVQDMLKPEYVQKTAEAHIRAIKTVQNLHEQGKVKFK